MIHILMGVLPGKSLIGHQKIGIYRTPRLYMLPHSGLEYLFSATRDNVSADPTTALKQSHNRNLILSAASSDSEATLPVVHVPRLAADESLVYFDVTAHLGKGPRLHR